MSAKKVFKRWQMQEAKARLSRLVKEAVNDGPQAITLHGQAVAVVLSMKQYEKLTGVDKRPNFLAALLQCPKGPELNIRRDPNDIIGAGTPRIFE